MKDFEKKLKITIVELPVHEPREEAWTSVCKRLDFNKNLAVVVQQMPTYLPDASSWENIKVQLRKPKNRSLKRNLIIAFSAAASIIFLIGIRLALHRDNSETISIAVETTNEWKSTPNTREDTLVDKAIRIINDECNNKSYVCNNPLFTEKKKQLLEVEEQLKNLRNETKKSGSTPSLVKSCTKLENLRTRLVKDLLNSIVS